MFSKLKRKEMLNIEKIGCKNTAKVQRSLKCEYFSSVGGECNYSILTRSFIIVNDRQINHLFFLPSFHDDVSLHFPKTEDEQTIKCAVHSSASSIVNCIIHRSSKNAREVQALHYNTIELSLLQ